MRLKTSYVALFVVVFFTLMGISCTKIKVQTVGGILKFSVDTLKFDTVFTAEGSFTTGLVIYNPQNEEVLISSVKLSEGANSFFHLNVDGFVGNNISNQPNLKIAAHDSMYVFATVNINPNNTTNPFLITDSLIVTMNGQNFYVPFSAYGQNAYYIVDSILAGTNITWGTKLPYVIINSAEVNTGSTRTILPGAHIYMHQNSALVVNGKLITQGTVQDSVLFQSDRPDPAYWNWVYYPGAWGGIYFGSYSNGSNLSYTRIESGGNGVLSSIPAEIIIFPDSFNMYTTGDMSSTTGTFLSSGTPQLSLNHCFVENSYGYGIYNLQGSLVASNTNFNTTGQQALAIIQGGYDSITNCTFANYGNTATGLAHTGYGTVAILDYYSDGVDQPTYGGLKAVMRNCIVYGSLDSEIICDATGTTSGITANLLFDHCLLKFGTDTESFVKFNACIFNQDPMFKSTASGDFHLTVGSPAIGAGDSIYTTVPGNVDLDGNSWNGGDIGCYKFTQ